MQTPLILLHGALGAADQMANLKTQLAADFPIIFDLDFSGHGKKSADDRPFSMRGFASDVCLFMEKNGLEKADFFGYSMGGYVALELARAAPEKARRIATLGTKFDWTRASATQATAALDPQKWLEKAPAFVEMLQKRHGAENWLAVVGRTKTMMHHLGNGDSLTVVQLGEIASAVLVMVGTLDNTVGIEEGKLAASWLPSGRFFEMPQTKHPFEQVDLELLAGRLVDFFKN